MVVDISVIATDRTGWGTERSGHDRYVLSGGADFERPAVADGVSGCGGSQENKDPLVLGRDGRGRRTLMRCSGSGEEDLWVIIEASDQYITTSTLIGDRQ